MSSGGTFLANNDLAIFHFSLLAPSAYPFLTPFLIPFLIPFSYPSSYLSCPYSSINLILSLSIFLNLFLLDVSFMNLSTIRNSIPKAKFLALFAEFRILSSVCTVFSICSSRVFIELIKGASDRYINSRRVIFVLFFILFSILFIISSPSKSFKDIIGIVNTQSLFNLYCLIFVFSAVLNTIKSIGLLFCFA